MNDAPNARDLNLSHVGKRTAYKLGFRAGIAMADPLDDPRVVALVQALEMAVLWLDYDGRYDTLGMKAALSAIEDRPPMSRPYMGQIMAECDCSRTAECEAAQRCLAEQEARP